MKLLNNIVRLPKLLLLSWNLNFKILCYVYTRSFYVHHLATDVQVSLVTYKMIG